MGGRLRRLRSARSENRSALRQESSASPEPERDRREHRGGLVAEAGAALGGRARQGRRALRCPAELQAGLRRSAPDRARLLFGGAAPKTRAREANRLARPASALRACE